MIHFETQGREESAGSCVSTGSDASEQHPALGFTVDHQGVRRKSAQYE
jgi:hypothetical protein